MLLCMIKRNICVCPRDTLTYECTAIGIPGGATVWTGTALSSCPSGEIVLLHSHFTSSGGISRSCDGARVAQSLFVQDNLYTLRLNITVLHNTEGETITCLYDAMTGDSSSDMIQVSTQIPGMVALTNLQLHCTQFAHLCDSYTIQVHFHHAIIFTSVLLILSQETLYSLGLQLPLTVLLSITTS